MPLAETLRARIAAQGPISFREWMDACLNSLDGYYALGGRIGTAAGTDFATAPSLHPFFGVAIGHEIEAAWQHAGRPAQWRAVEYGGGPGSLARAALAGIDEAAPELGAALKWTHVEQSPRHQEQQAGDLRLQWGDGTPPADVIVANEFVDALPFHWVQREGEAWSEVFVDVAGDAFVEVLRPAGRAALDALPPLPPGDRRVPAMAAAKEWIAQAAGSLSPSGMMLLIDYGGRGPEMWRGREDGSVRAFRAHEVQDDVLAIPGEQDLTASVDFEAIVNWAAAAGLKEASFETQEEWLLRHDVLSALNAVDRSTPAGASDYLRLRQLLLPTGLGAFCVQRLEPEA